MQKSLIILTVGALGVITTLFYLPKGIVRDENKNVESVTRSANRDSKGEVANSEAHQNNFSEDQKIKYEQLKKGFTLSKEKYADSLGKFFTELNRPDSAAAYYEVIANLKPGMQNWKKAGNTYYEAFRLALDSDKGNKYGEKARQFYGKILANDPNQLDVKSNMAMTYVSTSTPMQGIMLLREVIAKDPDNQIALMNLGLLSMQSHQYDKALDRFQQILAKHPDNSEARLYLAVSFAEAGKNDEALKEFNTLKLKEKDPVIIQTVDQYLQKLNQK